jgi:hypothetical protein
VNGNRLSSAAPLTQIRHRLTSYSMSLPDSNWPRRSDPSGAFYLPCGGRPPTTSCRESGPLFASPRLYGGGNSLMVSPAKF